MTLDAVKYELHQISAAFRCWKAFLRCYFSSLNSQICLRDAVQRYKDQKDLSQPKSHVLVQPECRSHSQIASVYTDLALSHSSMSNPSLPHLLTVPLLDPSVHYRNEPTLPKDSLVPFYAPLLVPIPPQNLYNLLSSFTPPILNFGLYFFNTPSL